MSYTQETPLKTELYPHMVKEIALALLKQWIELEHVRREQPTQKIDFVTLIQCFNKIGLLQVTCILQETDDTYLKNFLFKRSPHDIAKYFILSGGKYPQDISQLNNILK